MIPHIQFLDTGGAKSTTVQNQKDCILEQK